MRNQVATAKGEHVAALAWGMRKFYETINHDKLREMAVTHNFPRAVIDLALNAYRMERVVTYEGRPSNTLFPYAWHSGPGLAERRAR